MKDEHRTHPEQGGKAKTNPSVILVVSEYKLVSHWIQNLQKD